MIHLLSLIILPFALNVPVSTSTTSYPTIAPSVAIATTVAIATPTTVTVAPTTVAIWCQRPGANPPMQVECDSPLANVPYVPTPMPSAKPLPICPIGEYYSLVPPVGCYPTVTTTTVDSTTGTTAVEISDTQPDTVMPLTNASPTLTYLPSNTGTLPVTGSELPWWFVGAAFMAVVLGFIMFMRTRGGK